MSPKGEKHGCQTAPLDILCSLPENVIDDILVRLPLRDAVRTSILSKKWRYNWCRLPELTLDLTSLISTKDSIPPMFKFTNIIYHLLTLHTGPITKFDLSFSSNLIPCPTIDNLIYFLSRNDIQHLVLKLCSRGDPYKLPSSLFTCYQLRHLTLENCLILPPQAFEGFDQLVCLELRFVTISSKFLESLISHCPLLEQLELDIISGLSGVVEINAPMLRYFNFTGKISSICLKYIPLVTELSLVDTECYEGPRKCNIAKFFESFSAVKHLELNHGSLKFLAAGGELPTRLPFDLNCVKRLCLANVYLDELDVISCALCLIRSFPYLRYLEIQVLDENDDIPALGSLEVEAFSDMTFNHLWEVKITGILGSKPEMQLIKLLLAKSPVLFLSPGAGEVPARIPSNIFAYLFHRRAQFLQFHPNMSSNNKGVGESSNSSAKQKKAIYETSSVYEINVGVGDLGFNSDENDGWVMCASKSKNKGAGKKQWIPQNPAAINVPPLNTPAVATDPTVTPPDL